MTEREIKNARVKAELPRYLAGRGIDIRRAFRCLNPKHDDKQHPSMSYDRQHNRCNCFACNARYDIFDVVEVCERLDKGAAFKRAYEYAGEALPAIDKPMERSSAGNANAGGSDWRAATRRGFNAQSAKYIAKDATANANAAGSDWRRAIRFNAQAAKDAGENATPKTQAQQVQKQKESVQNVNEEDISHEQVRSFLEANNVVGEVAQRFYAAELKSGFKDLDSAQANFRRKLEKDRFIFGDLRKIMQIAKELVSAKSKRDSANKNSMPVLIEDEGGEPLLAGRSA